MENNAAITYALASVKKDFNDNSRLLFLTGVEAGMRLAESGVTDVDAAINEARQLWEGKITGNKTVVYIATVQGGRGPGVWENEVPVTAASLVEAAEKIDNLCKQENATLISIVAQAD